MPAKWEPIAQKKQAERDSKIPKDWRLSSLPGDDVIDVRDIPRSCGILTTREVDITENYDATDLAQAIRTKKFSCVEVTTAFCKRAAIAQQLINCLTEIFFEDAIKHAAFLDYVLERDGKPMGPLHGIPISLKDTFRLPGIDSSLGTAFFSFKPSLSTTPLLSILQSAGAVFYCKTNVPQTMMSLDSENNIFGRTLNARNKRVTAGGSSGGEGALLGIKGSVLGIGTDIGGSIRIPAFCNGLYGIKPSANRVPHSGQNFGSLPGTSAVGVSASTGPMGRSVRDCELFLKTVAAAKPWEVEPHLVPGPWDSLDLARNTSADFSNLKIGILATDNLVTPLPPVAASLAEVGKALRSAGATVVDLPAPAVWKDAQSLANALFGLDGGNRWFDVLEAFDEPSTTWLAPRTRRKTPKSLAQARDMHAQREAMMTEMLSLWRAGGVELDAILCPVAPHPVPPLDSWAGVNYTSSWVLFDCATGVIPLRDVTQADIKVEIASKAPMNNWDRLNMDLWDKVDRSVYVGTPLSVQVVAPRLQEKRLVRAMAGIDEAIRRFGDGVMHAKL